MNVENMRKAVSYLITIPASKWEMLCFTSGRDGTGPCCALGHLSRAGMLGFSYDSSQIPCLKAEGLMGSAAADHIFGSGVYFKLFTSLLVPENGETSFQQSWGKERFFVRLLRLMEMEGISFDAIFGTDDLPENAQVKAKDECVA